MENNQNAKTSASPETERTARKVINKRENEVKTDKAASDKSEIKYVSREDYVELKYRSVKDVGAEKLATGLGWFSIALGLAELFVPEKMGELVGIDEKRQSLLPIFGLREIASGIAILSMTRPAGAVWSRVGGDAIDLAFLGSAYASDETDKTKVTAAALAVLSVMALDIMCAQRLSQDINETNGNPNAPTTVGQPSARHSV